MWTTRRQPRPLRAQRCRVPGMTIVRARSSLIPFGEPLDHSREPERKVQCTTRRVKTLLLLSADTRSPLNRMPRRVRRPRRLLSKRTLQRRRDRPGSQKRFCIWKASQCMSRRTTVTLFGQFCLAPSTRRVLDSRCRSYVTRQSTSAVNDESAL